MIALVQETITYTSLGLKITYYKHPARASITSCINHVLLQEFDGWVSVGTLFHACLKYTFFEHIIVSFQAISTWHSVKSEYIFPTAIWLWYEEITVKVNYPIQNQFSPEGFPKCFWSTREINLPEKLCDMHIDMLV